MDRIEPAEITDFTNPSIAEDAQNLRVLGAFRAWRTPKSKPIEYVVGHGEYEPGHTSYVAMIGMGDEDLNLVYYYADDDDKALEAAHAKVDEETEWWD